MNELISAGFGLGGRVLPQEKTCIQHTSRQMKKKAHQKNKKINWSMSTHRHTGQRRWRAPHAHHEHGVRVPMLRERQTDRAREERERERHTHTHTHTHTNRQKDRRTHTQ